jgi:hypothetical protein
MNLVATPNAVLPRLATGVAIFGLALLTFFQFPAIRVRSIAIWWCSIRMFRSRFTMN